MNPFPEYNKLFSSDESRKIDSRTIDEFGVDSFTLMETAALGAADIIQENHCSNEKGLYICGKGNNAGDALAVARLLLNRLDHNVDLLFPLGDQGFTADTLKNYKLLTELKSLGSEVHILDEDATPSFQNYDYVVDGLFGTGISRDIEGTLSDLILNLNQSGVPIYSMDIPSGLSGDSGRVFGSCVKATATITFGTRKLGLYLKSASDYTGQIYFVPLQFPSQYLQSNAFLLDQELYETIPLAERVARHKYDQGVVHVLAGSEGLTGAAITACRSAWKNGAGAVFLYAPKKLLPIYETTLPEVIKIPLGSDVDSCYKEEHSEKILTQLRLKPGMLLAGPGIGTQEGTQQCLIKVFESYRGPALIDADALCIWTELKKLTSAEQNNWIFTPHIGEATSYMNATISDDLERLEWATAAAKEHSCSIFMKGNPAFFIAGNGDRFVTSYSTHMFSKAGFGDQLAGAIAAQAAIRNSIRDATLYTLFKSYLMYKNRNTKNVFTPQSLI